MFWMIRDLWCRPLAVVLLVCGCGHLQESPAVYSEEWPQATEEEIHDLPGGFVPTSYQCRPAVNALTLPSSVARRRQIPVSPAAKERGYVTAVALEEPRRIPEPSRPLPILMGHGVNYSWLVGCLVHDEATGRWMVRYTDPGYPDPFGGILELIRTGPMSGFNSGQRVRVEGELVDPAPYEIKPSYRVRSLQRVES